MPAAYLLLALLFTSEPEPGVIAPIPRPLGEAPQADTSSTSWACSLDTLKSSHQCIFDVEPTPEANTSPEQLESQVKQIATGLCAVASKPSGQAKPDATLRGACEREMTGAVEVCTSSQLTALVDAEGRFVNTARPCYQALERVVQRIRLRAALASDCCQCLAQSRCQAGGPKCYDALAHGRPEASALSCMADACMDACATLLPSGPAPAAAPEPGPLTVPSKGGHSAKTMKL